MGLRIINAAQTTELLPMPECIEAMEPAMRAISRGSMVIPPRILFGLHDGSGFLAAMPGSSEDALGAKLVSFLPANPKQGRFAINGFVALFDHGSGDPVALIDGRVLTNVRTAAASGLATRLLSRENSQSCGIIGTGALADVHIDAMCAVRDLAEVLVWGRDKDKAEALAQRHHGRNGVKCRAVDSLEEASACDLVCTTTLSKMPLVEGRWLKPGAHLNLVGAHSLDAREADTQAIVKSRVFVDSMESTSNEGGDIMIPVEEGAMTLDHVQGELGQLLDGQIQGRLGEGDITLFNSLGLVSEDLYAALHVYRAAEEQNVGVVVDF